jgi:uncharacterized NAD(P)/FAD-binding protein YdhS
VDESADLWTQWKRLLAKKSPDPLEVARLARAFERYFDAVKTEAVKAARARGVSWDAVAESLGTTRQSAWERYRRQERARRGEWATPFGSHWSG